MAKKEEMNEKVIRSLKSLERRGRLTAESVVEKARNPKDPLHAYFEWDDGKAAHEFRLEQARRLLRSIPVIVTTTHGQVKTVCYVRDPDVIPEQGYISMEQLRKENREPTIKVLLDIEFERAAAALRRAETIAAALDMRGEIVEVRTRVDTLRDRVWRESSSPPPEAHP